MTDQPYQGRVALVAGASKGIGAVTAQAFAAAGAAVVLSARDREITVLLHENHPLPPSLRKQVNARKKSYIRFLETVIAEVQQDRGILGGVSARAATFALLGMINWLYQWYKQEGTLSAEQIAHEYTEIFFAGAFH